MKAYVWPADMWACGHYRLIWPSETIHGSEPDFDVEVMVPRPDGDTGLRAWMDDSDGVVNASCPEDADLVIFQRPSFPQLVHSIPHFRRQGIAVVVDIDDDLSAIDPRNPAFAALHPDPFALLSNAQITKMLADLGERPPADYSREDIVDRILRRRYKLTSPHSWLAVKEAAKLATVVTVSTPALAERYGRGNAVVLPNCLPARFCDAARVDSDLVGWPGSMHSHPGDLKVLGNSIARLGGRFMIVGQGDDAARELGVAEVPQTGPIPFDGWMEAVGQLGVGVAPLADTSFNAAKSWLKPLEMSAAGVPWVASPRAEYQRFHRLGVGALADRPKDWLRELRRLVTDAGWRAEQSEAGRAVARGLTIEQHAWRTAEVWHRAVELERARRPQGASAV